MPIVYRNDARHSGVVQKPYINPDPTRRSRKGSGKTFSKPGATNRHHET